MKGLTLLLPLLFLGLPQTSLPAAPPIITTTVTTTATTTTTAAKAGVYDKLPEDYSGDYYVSDDRYYYGGKMERGKFHHDGRDYEERYFHNGKYLYGGKFGHSESHHNEDKK